MENKKDDNIINNPNLKEQKYREEKYYQELYNNLPNEVVELLMKTHPLMGKENIQSAEEKYATRHNRIDEVDEVRKQRKESALKKIEETKLNTNDLKQSELNGEKINPNVFEEEIKVHSFKQEMINKDDKVQTGNEIIKETEEVKIKDDDSEDMIQLVKIKGPASRHQKKGTIMAYEHDNKQTQKKTHSGKKNTSEKKAKPLNSDYIDLDKINKEATLDDFFRDDDYDECEESKLPDKKTIFTIGIAVAICLLVFLTFKTFSLSSKLKKAEPELKKYAELQVQFEELKLDKLSVDEELSLLKGGGKDKTSSDGTKESVKEGSQEKPESKLSGKYDIYTIKDGDTFWDISGAVYGNGAYYTRILEANGLTENSPIKSGQTLKIPK